MNPSAVSPGPRSPVPGPGASLPWHNPHRTQLLLDALASRILIIDGAMGTMIQRIRPPLTEADFRGTALSARCEGTPLGRA